MRQDNRRTGVGRALVRLAVVILGIFVLAACGGSSGQSAKSPGASGGVYATAAHADAEYGGDYADDAAPAEEGFGGGGDEDMMIEAEEMRADVHAEAPPPPPAQSPRIAQVDKKAPPSKPKPATVPGGQTTPGKDRPSADTPTDQKVATPLLIYTATLHMGVFEVDKALDKTERMARDLGGYLVRRDDRTIIIRVPSKKFQSMLESIGAIGDVLHREVTVEDVTEQFYDLQIRLKNLRAVRDRFEQLLQRAKTVEEALKVQRELERVTTEIERMEGRLKVLKELIAFSTITVEFRPRGTENVNPNFNLPFPWLHSLGLGQLLRL